jgi:hypothetical protein
MTFIFRSLTEFEIAVLKEALENLTTDGRLKEARTSARLMLEQKMPESFLWREK